MFFMNFQFKDRIFIIYKYLFFIINLLRILDLIFITIQVQNYFFIYFIIMNFIITKLFLRFVQFLIPNFQFIFFN
jgi:hypothetical protein